MIALTTPRRPRTATRLYYVPVALNVVGQVNGGGMQTAGPGTARWIIDGSSIRGEDGSGIDRGGGPGVTAKLGSDGSFFASNILLQSAGAGARMKLDASVPIEQIIDSSGIVRAEFGNLGANGQSTAGYKMRANDSLGNPVFDSDGLIAVMTSLGTSLVTSVTFTVDPSNIASVSFSLARQSTVFAMAYASGSTAGVSGSYSQMWLTPDSVAYVNNVATWDKANPGICNGSGFQLATLAAGSHTYYLKAGPNAGQTLSILRANLQVFLLGG